MLDLAQPADQRVRTREHLVHQPSLTLANESVRPSSPGSTTDRRRWFVLRDLARLSLAETVDAIEVLSQGALATDSDPAIRSARVKLLVARVALGLAQHLTVPGAIDNLLGVALQQLREARSALATPATLPPSFRN
jgi:hypothetical protein